MPQSFFAQMNPNIIHLDILSELNMFRLPCNYDVSMSDWSSVFFAVEQLMKPN